MSGIVNLVGAGPGDPGLLTLRGAEVLRRADVVVYDRLAQEALACARGGIEFEVVPGVSSAVAAPAYLGIPVTHRGLSSGFAVVTGTGASGARAELERAAAVETLVVLMAAGRLPEVCGRLVKAGRSPDEPAALVEWATTSRQRGLVSTLSELPGVAGQARLGPPATLVVGPVVALAHELAWFDRIPDAEDELPA